MKFVLIPLLTSLPGVSVNFIGVLIIILDSVSSFGETQSNAVPGPPPPRASFSDQAWKQRRSLPEGAAFAVWPQDGHKVEQSEPVSKLLAKPLAIGFPSVL